MKCEHESEYPNCRRDCGYRTCDAELERMMKILKKPMHGHSRFYALLDEIADLHSRKNSNYANDDPLSNFKECERFGIPAFHGCLVRMSDKWSRIVELAKGKPDAVGESLSDTLKDLSVYSLIAIILLEREKK